jgi:hypothetical protein
MKPVVMKEAMEDMSIDIHVRDLALFRFKFFIVLRLIRLIKFIAKPCKVRYIYHVDRDDRCGDCGS